ncbi:MAG: ribose-phosphate pyrophosphokinase [Oscillospiraceae bacterium]|nr:ribose-phosphate pyrophosphokinase [Oscillospiraceae bacterium]
MIKINDAIIENKQFPDNTKLMRYDASGSTKFEVIWCYDSDDELVMLYYLVSHIRSICSKAEISLTMPYIPNARMDRVKNNDEVFTLKYFASLLNSMKFESVNVYDPHSNVSQALIDRIRIIPHTDIINEVMTKINFDKSSDYLFYPDAGCAKKYEGILEYPYLKGEKERDWRSGKINNLRLLGEIGEQGFGVLIIDDICSRGGTFYHSADKLKKAGAGNIYLYVTHCENSILDGDMIKSGLIDRVFTTDSIYTGHHPDIEIVRSFRK